MAELRIILADLVAELNPSSSMVIQWPSPIRQTLQDHFDDVIASQSSNKSFPFSSASVRWWSSKLRGGSSTHPGTQPLALGSQDLIVYLVQNSNDSVLQHMPGSRGGGSGTGFTVFSGKLTASEVYTSGNQGDPVGLGKVAFHELMHFASHLMDSQLHNLTVHGKQPMSLSAATVTASTQLSKGDISFMAENLPKQNRQPWIGGYTAYIDPSNGHV